MQPITALLVLFLIYTASCMTIKIEPKAEECFYEEYKSGQELHVKWNVIDGGLLDIDVRVKLGNNIIFNKIHYEAKEEGVFKTTTTSSGTYSICFNNEMARYTPKTVHFEFVSQPAETTSKPSSDSLTPMEKSLKKIGSAIKIVEQHVTYFHYREATHRNTAESTNSKVQWWAIVETFALLLISVGQVYYLKRKVNKSNTTKRRV